ncbi:DUF6801 domain-containing protein [Amycolatopsis keratiniphila]|uniref:DUF6801 domain-containing protein n=1 Tax=Amycolatopsis keratiniphila subsp. keratiniphila TaxID=227715 RepID=A0A1W2M042_9PSEU|nr:DUF6801 domain-containing protein [Amycolatopsis keratiniphila]OLZ58814.1 hypothetical protein BS330_10405 [Amycolatopsis keratiniphila subsp. nogabecina]ONF72521.1 hypothetical protein AVR91_0210015 [Amycolatopsis keratiniphila subsp. keratiniphila]SDU69905.1 hypothetical protein SAMN04489733_8597 [Amycolatopsis keratiniphila]
MTQRLRRASGCFAAVFAVLASLTAGTASAATTHATGVVVYMCGFPMIGQQPLDITARFDGPGTVTTAGTFTPAAIAGTATFSAIHNATIFSAANYDGVRGEVTAPLTGANLTPSSATVTGLDVPEQITPYVPGPRTITFAQDATTTVPSFTAGTPGSATLALGTTFKLELDFHKRDGSWDPWTLNCTVKNTNPAQNRTFAPSIPVV